MSYIIFDGKSSEDLGLVIEKMPDLARAKRRVESIDVPGRSGTLHVDEGGYDELTLKVTMNLFGAATIRDVNDWLNGSGNLILSDNPTKCYKARADDEIKYKRMRTCSGRVFDSATVTFKCDPFLYEIVPEEIVLLRAHAVNNPGSVEALPLIDVTGSGNVVLTVGDVSVTLTGISGTIRIDCDAKTVYQGETQAGGMVTLNDHVWPTFPVGDTNVYWSGSVSSVTITPNWRWL